MVDRRENLVFCVKKVKDIFLTKKGVQTVWHTYWKQDCSDSCLLTIYEIQIYNIAFASNYTVVTNARPTSVDKVYESIKIIMLFRTGECHVMMVVW